MSEEEQDDATPSEIARLLGKLASAIGGDGLNELVSRCKHILGDLKVHSVKSCDHLLRHLRDTNLLTTSNWLQIVELLQDIGRYDIIGQVKSFCKKHGFPSEFSEGHSLPEVNLPGLRCLVFSVAPGKKAEEVIPNIMAAINMLVFQTGSNVMWFLGMGAVGKAHFLVMSDRAAQIMEAVHKYPAWLAGISVLSVDMVGTEGEDASVTETVSQPGEISEIPPEEEAKITEQYERLLKKIADQCSDTQALIEKCQVIMEPSEFGKVSSVEEVLDLLSSKSYLTPYNLTQLSELMRQIGRGDLGRMVDHKSRRFKTFAAENDNILPKTLGADHCLLCLELVGKRPTSEAIRNIMDASSMILMQTAAPTLWYLACVSHMNFRLYFVIRKQNLNVFMATAHNQVKWMKDLMILSVTAQNQTVTLKHNEAEDETEDLRHSRSLMSATREVNESVVETLLGLGADALYKGEDDETAVHRASQRGHKPIVELLLNYGGSVFSQTKEECLQPLHLAAERGHLPVVDLLMESEADVNAQAWAGMTALHAASAKGHLDVVDLLVTGKKDQKADVNVSDQDGDRPIHYAALEGHSRVVAKLLQEGCPVDCRTKDGQTPLQWAAGNNHCRAAEVLLDFGANPDAKDNAHCTSLHWAADNGHAAIGEVLLERGAEVNGKNQDGDSALHWAAADGHLALTGVLLDYRIKVDMKNKDGNTALHLAVTEGYTAIVEMLLDIGMASVNETTKNGSSPLHLAAYGGHYRIAEKLIKKGASINSSNYDLFTPLHAATLSGSVPIAGLLIKHLCHLNARDKEEWTALHVAAYKSQGGVVELLLNSGADHSAQDNCGRTPFQLAEIEGKADVVDIFRKRQAAVTVL